MTGVGYPTQLVPDKLGQDGAERQKPVRSPGGPAGPCGGTEPSEGGEAAGETVMTRVPHSRNYRETLKVRRHCASGGRRHSGSQKLVSTSLSNARG